MQAERSLIRSVECTMLLADGSGLIIEIPALGWCVGLGAGISSAGCGLRGRLGVLTEGRQKKHATDQGNKWEFCEQPIAFQSCVGRIGATVKISFRSSASEAFMVLNYS